MSLIVGYTISGQDNDSTMFGKKLPLRRCPGCGFRLDFFATNPDYAGPTIKGMDYSVTYDNQDIVSRAFRDFVLEKGYRGIRFGPFTRDPEHFHLLIDRVVPFDAERRKVRFERPCKVCGNCAYVVGALPAYLRVASVLDDGFYRTDLFFGSNDAKSALTIVAPRTHDELAMSRLQGLEFHPAFGAEST
jgi:hypothetical protein